MVEPVPTGTPGGSLSISEGKEASNFHFFPKLPPELRLKIWKAACFPRSSTDHGIHFVTVDRVPETDDLDGHVTLHPDLEGYDDEFDIENEETAYVTLRAVRRKRPETRKNASGYLYDAGLWIACRESRGAITEHLDINGWLALKASGSHDVALKPKWYYKLDFPSTIKPHRKDEPWRPLVAPRQDIFCMCATNGSLQLLPKSLYGMKMLAPFIGTRNFTIVEDWNIAFRFNQRWNHRFPTSIEHLVGEVSPRGFLASWLGCFQDEAHPEPTLYVIDDTGSWVAPSGWIPRSVFRDCDIEYVQVPWSASYSDEGIDGVGPAGSFIERFGKLVDEDLFDDGDSLYEWLPSPEVFIRLLVRKDNQVIQDPVKRPISILILPLW
ncbi:hypothetical protein NW768_009970 [Fusarium equiseti]|uniref:2EXR domain-containing protein n=1 Tax=Fusarium equiseti TaxID=61235 RepID=A0ABQ8R1K3_FUSEQ|nr:hypothetical protein NW768_009970 [Fusarium equiseti]